VGLVGAALCWFGILTELMTLSVRAAVWTGETLLIILDFRETAPAAASEDMYGNDAYGSIRGGLASGIPGDLRGLEYLHNKYGVSYLRLLFVE
jgi:gamma-glutamyltranspeptidase